MTIQKELEHFNEIGDDITVYTNYVSDGKPESLLVYIQRTWSDGEKSYTSFDPKQCRFIRDSMDKILALHDT